MLASALFLLLAQSASEPARTVNGIELGPAQDFTTTGPAVVCMRDMVLRPRVGQSVQLAYSGIHAGTLRLVLANGKYVEFSDGEIFRDQRRPGQGPSEVHDDMKIYLVSDRGPDVRYQLEGSGVPTDEYSPPRVLVSGTGVAGNRADRALFDLVTFEKPDTVHCDRRFAYGWGTILEGDPIDVPQGAANKAEN